MLFVEVCKKKLQKKESKFLNNQFFLKSLNLI